MDKTDIDQGSGMAASIVRNRPVSHRRGPVAWAAVGVEDLARLDAVLRTTWTRNYVHCHDSTGEVPCRG